MRQMEAAPEGTGPTATWPSIRPATLLALAGCNLPGKPTPGDIVQRPTDILDPVAGVPGAGGGGVRCRKR